MLTDPEDAFGLPTWVAYWREHFSAPDAAEWDAGMQRRARGRWIPLRTAVLRGQRDVPVALRDCPIAGWEAVPCASWWSTRARAASSCRCSTETTSSCPPSARRPRRRSLRPIDGIDAVGHRVVHGGTGVHGTRRDRRRRGARAARTSPARAAAPARAVQLIREARRTAARRAARRLLRHRVPRDDAGRREDVRAAQGVARPLAAATVRLPRSLARVRVPHRRGSARPSARGPCGSSRATSARARRCARCGAAGPSTRRWA